MCVNILYKLFRNYINIDVLKKTVPEILPTQIRQCLIKDFNLSLEESTFLMEHEIAEYLLSVMNSNPELDVYTVYEMVRIALLGLMYKRNIPASKSPVSPELMAELLTLYQDNEINSDYAQKTFDIMAENGGSPTQIIDERNWRMIKDTDVILTLCKEALKSIDRKKLEKYVLGKPKKSGSKNVINKMVNTVMELSNNKVHTRIAKLISIEVLDDWYSNSDQIK